MKWALNRSVTEVSKCLRKARASRVFCVRNISFFLSMLLFQSQAWAIDWFRWKAYPSVTFNETYSDNIQLATKGNEDSAFVTEINPGISLFGTSGKTTVNLNYRMQNVFNAGGNDDHDIFHQLQFNGFSELVRNRLFLDMDSSVSQQNISNTNQSNSNINGGNNRADIYTFGVSPYWTPHFNGYADGLLRLRYNTISSEDINTGQTAANFSDTDIFSQTARLTSGWRFSKFQWAINFHNEEQTRSNATNQDVTFQSGDIFLRAIYDRHWSGFAQVGFVENDFGNAGANATNNNGYFYTIGARWIPSQRFSIEAGVGNNSFVTVTLNPIRHMSWVTTYRHNDVGANTGDIWETAFNYSTKRSTWRIRYFEDTVTTQTLLSRLQTFTVVDQFGQPIIDPVTNQPVTSVISLPTLTNEVFITRRAEFSVGYRTGKTNISLTAFSANREFQTTQNTEDVYGISAFLNWNFMRRTNLYLRPSYQHTDREQFSQQTATTIGDKQDRFDIAVGVSRVIPLRISRGGNALVARLEYAYTDQSNSGTSGINSGFVENRVTGSLLVRF